MSNEIRNPSAYAARHFLWRVEGRVGRITLNRPEKRNPLTFESYAELRDLFRALTTDTAVRAVVIDGAGGNFCSGGDVHDIIGPLTKLDMPGLPRAAADEAARLPGAARVGRDGAGDPGRRSGDGGVPEGGG